MDGAAMPSCCSLNCVVLDFSRCRILARVAILMVLAGMIIRHDVLYCTSLVGELVARYEVDYS